MILLFSARRVFCIFTRFLSVFGKKNKFNRENEITNTNESGHEAKIASTRGRSKNKFMLLMCLALTLNMT